ncbi:MAG TPA: SURF1 family protein, partial [Actinomycetota bacterium]|nr:SURF1 family protein [Actinomycetota bacterium]
MHHFLTRRWITIHLLTLVIIAVCLSLASWQLGRLQDRRAENARLAAQTRFEPAGLDRLLPGADAAPAEVTAAEFRRTRVQGTFDTGEQVILQSRSLNRLQGNHLLTPLVLASGEAILVDRGWVPLPTDEEVLSEAEPPSGQVTVEGVLLPSEEKGLLGVSDPPPGEVTATPRVDLDRLAG